MGALKRLMAMAMLLGISACAHPQTRRDPGSQAAIMSALSGTLAYQYHACVPLGWRPVPVVGTYYAGYIASVQNYAEFLDAIWRARISVKELSNPQIRDVYQVLNHLVSAGLLARKRRSSFYDYYLTDNALGYYYGASRYDNNRGRMQYLCYSSLVPDRILWLQRISRPSDWRGRAQWYRVSFTWKASAPAHWAAGDPFLLAHSVILAPVKSPALALMYYAGNEWHIGNLYDYTWMLPALRDASAWNAKAGVQRDDRD